MFLTVFKLVNNGFSFQNGSWLNWVGSQVCVGDRFGNLFDNRSRGSNNGSRGGNHGGAINHGSGSWSCYIGSSHIGSSDIRSNYRYGSSLLFNLNRFSSFDSHRCSWGNIGVVGIGVTITSVVVIGVVVEPIVIIVVGVVTVTSVVVSIVVSSLSFGFGFGFG